MDVQTSFASQLHETARKLGTAAPGDPARAAGEEATGQSFAEAVAEAARGIGRNLEEGEASATRAMTGRGDVQSVVEALSRTELALQTATTVRDRVVQAYQEILRMPV
jgi:flagellar hook-basal body complex protein FliE